MSLLIQVGDIVAEKGFGMLVKDDKIIGRELSRVRCIVVVRPLAGVAPYHHVTHRIAVQHGVHITFKYTVINCERFII